ncbi:MAG: hypothetical protein L6V83_02350 [Christensenella sp.]|nr:MAG: hypothetical protein L6V83_02350 [Christensenella sp.]
MSVIDEKLKAFQELVDDGMSAKNTVKAFELIGINGYDEELVKTFKLWGDFMPMGDEDPYTEEQRNLHILWDSIDRVPLGVNCAFSVPFRAIIAKKLFKKCGDGFVANEGCRFNYGHRIEVGENVSWNSGCFIDSKGGVKMGDFAMLTEYVKIFYALAQRTRPYAKGIQRSGDRRLRKSVHQRNDFARRETRHGSSGCNGGYRHEER